ncbi:uncharacterized protein LOC118422958 [Branchiostoma floridae]|uniref:Uncharacterized protein LOC118422958 n=1 Tax=Branchiostoma floridae TaxID=7739 RepID=A0A9J7LQZ5_BRAFL|nr:uncharacterized protein LOC118422958 [Branchiostoma floridae]
MPPRKQNLSEDDMSTIKDLLEQQQAKYEDLLQRQQSIFQSFIESVMTSTNNRFDNLVREVQELKSSLQFSQHEVDTLKTKLNEANSEITNLKATIDDQAKNPKSLQMPDMEKKMDYLENQSRRNNVVIDGIEDDVKETWADTEVKVRNILTKKLQLDSKTIEIERAHRNGPFRNDSPRPRQVVVKLLRFKDKQMILNRARSNLKNTNIYINEDFSDQVRKRRAELVPKMREARQRGEFAIISYDRLVIRKKTNQEMS